MFGVGSNVLRGWAGQTLARRAGARAAGARAAGWASKATGRGAQVTAAQARAKKVLGQQTYDRVLQQTARTAGAGRIGSFASSAAWGAVKGVGLYTFGSFISRTADAVDEAYGGVIGGVAQAGGFVVGGGFKLAGYRAGGRGALRGLHRASLVNQGGLIRTGMTGGVTSSGGPMARPRGAGGKFTKSTSGYVKASGANPGVMADQLGTLYRTADPTGRTVMTSAQAMRMGMIGKKNYPGRLTGGLLSGYENWLYHKPRGLFFGSYGRGKRKGKRMYRVTKDGNPQSRLARVLMNTPEPLRGVAGAAAITGRTGLLLGKGLYAASKLPLKMAHGAAGLAYAGAAGTLGGFLEQPFIRKRLTQGPRSVFGHLATVKHPIAGAFGLGAAYGVAGTMAQREGERQGGWIGTGPHGTDPVMQMLGTPGAGIRQRNYGGGITFANNTGRRRITLGSEAVATRMAFGGKT
jgi:hypothetical protein